MSLRSKPLENIANFSRSSAPDASGSARKPASPLSSLCPQG